jgi:hypothetical protein
MTPLYIVQERENSSWRGLGAGVALGGVGVLLYFLIKGLGGSGGRGAGLALLMRPRDEKRLTFVMTQPTADDPSRPMSFRGSDAKMFSLDEMISRVKAGGRSDVTLKMAGNVRQGSAESALTLVKQAGIEVWKEAAPGGASVSGNDRGQYWSAS